MRPTTLTSSHLSKSWDVLPKERRKFEAWGGCATRKPIGCKRSRPNSGRWAQRSASATMLLRSAEEEWSVARSTRNTIIGWQCLVQSQASVHQEIHRFAMQKLSQSPTQNSSKTLPDSEWT